MCRDVCLKASREVGGKKQKKKKLRVNGVELLPGSQFYVYSPPRRARGPTGLKRRKARSSAATAQSKEGEK